MILNNDEKKILKELIEIKDGYSVDRCTKIDINTTPDIDADFHEENKSKCDILGLASVNIDETLKIINKSREKNNLEPITLEDISLMDISTYKCIKDPQLDIFRMESNGTKSMLNEVYAEIFSKSNNISKEDLMDNLILPISYDLRKRSY
ncbi:MAG: hypothetical protein IJ086_05745 [Clostridium sp.]|nr:hypothetical protein [Clostridium sp.]